MAGKPTLGQRALIELIGTFIFVFLGAGVVIAAYFISPTYPSLLVIALANGLALGLAITLAMGVSGGHINPVVTLSMFITKRIDAKGAIVYVIAQLVGATLAGLFLVALMPHAAGAAVHYGAPSLGSSVTVLQAIGLEAVMTFFLVMMVFGTTVDSRAQKVAGFGVGLVVAIDAMVGGPLTGAAMNPARAIGPAIASIYFANWYVYWIGPIIGAVVAALIYNYCIIGKNK